MPETKKPRQLLKTTVRGYGSVEVWYIQQTRSSGIYEIVLTYSFASHKNNSPPSEFEYSLDEALQVMAKYSANLVNLKTMVEAF